MLRTRRQKAPEGAADGAGGDARVASLERENQRLRDLVGRELCSGRLALCDQGAFWSALRSRQRPGRMLCRCIVKKKISCLQWHLSGPETVRPASPGACLPLQLAEQVGSGATKSSYLCKYRGHATGSLWAPTWELRWVGGRLPTPAACKLPARAVLPASLCLPAVHKTVL